MDEVVEVIEALQSKTLVHDTSMPRRTSPYADSDSATSPSQVDSVGLEAPLLENDWEIVDSTPKISNDEKSPPTEHAIAECVEQLYRGTSDQIQSAIDRLHHYVTQHEDISIKLIVETGGVAALTNLVLQSPSDTNSAITDVVRALSTSLSASVAIGLAGGARILVNNLKTDNKAQQTAALFGLAECVSTQRDDVLHAEGVDLLLEFMEYGNEAQSNYAGIALEKLADGTVEDDQAFTAKHLRLLINLARGRHESHKRQAESILSSLAGHYAHQLATMGCTTVFLNTLKTKGVSRSAMRALARLAETGSDQCGILVQGGAIPVLVDTLRNDDDDLRRDAAVIIGCITHHNSNHAMQVILRGAIPSLIVVLDSPSDETKQAATRAIGHIAQSHRDLAVQADIVPALVHLMGFTTSAAVQDASEALRRLATDEATCLEIVEAGGMLVMFDMLSLGDEIEKDMANFILALVMAKNTDVNCSTRVTDPLMMYVHRGTDVQKEMALEAVCEIVCADGARSQAVLHEGTFDVLNDVMNDTETTSLQLLLASSILCLTGSLEHDDWYNLIYTRVQIFNDMISGGDTRLQIHAVFVLSELLAHRRADSTLPTIPNIVFEDVAETVTSSSNYLCDLGLRALVASMGMGQHFSNMLLSPFVDLADTGTTASRKVAAFVVVGAILETPTSQRHPHEIENVVSVIVKALKGGDAPEVKEAAAFCIVPLADRCADEFDAQGVVSLLLERLRSDGDRCCSVSSLVALAKSDSTRRDRIVAAGAVSLLTKMLESGTTKEKLAALDALVDITTDDFDLSQHFTIALEDEDTEVVAKCLELILRLVSTTNSTDRVKSAGFLPRLKKLANQDGQPTVQNLARQILTIASPS